MDIYEMEEAAEREMAVISKENDRLVDVCAEKDAELLKYQKNLIAEEVESELLHNEIALLKAERDGVGSTLLDIQQDCVKANAEIVRLKAAIKEQGMACVECEIEKEKIRDETRKECEEVFLVNDKEWPTGAIPLRRQLIAKAILNAGKDGE